MKEKNNTKKSKLDIIEWAINDIGYSKEQIESMSRIETLILIDDYRKLVELTYGR